MNGYGTTSSGVFNNARFAGAPMSAVGQKQISDSVAVPSIFELMTDLLFCPLLRRRSPLPFQRRGLPVALIQVNAITTL
jgi:hypothetical protein